MTKEKHDESSEELEDLLEEEEDTPDESSPSNEEEGEPSQEGDNTPEEEMPFHKHPRWKELQEEKKALKEQNDAFKAQLEDLNKFKEETSSKFNKQTEEPPQWYKEFFGEDETAMKNWPKFQEYEEQRYKTVEERAIERIKQERQQQEQLQKQAEQQLEGQLSELKEEGHDFNKNELFKIADELNLYDHSTGIYNLKAANEVLQARKATSKLSEKRKSVASKVSGGKTQAPEQQRPMTLEEAKRMAPW